MISRRTRLLVQTATTLVLLACAAFWPADAQFQMAISPVVPILGLIAAAWYLNEDEEVVPVTLPAGAGDALTEMRDLSSGGQARYFKAEVAQKVLAHLGGVGLQPVKMTGLDPSQGQVFKVVQQFQPGQEAKVLIGMAVDKGLVVMGSLSLPMVASGADRLVLFTGATKRAQFAPEKGQWAILTDPAGATQASTRQPSAASKGPQAFDEDLPADVLKEVNAALADPNMSPAKLRSMANDLEAAGFPIAAAALRKRADSIELQQTLADKKAGGTPFKIRAGAGGVAVDLAFYLAQHYTGVGNRWKEIVPINPGMSIVPSQWGNVPKPWAPGQVVLLPLDWDVRHKPVPAPLGIPKDAPNPVQTKPVPADKPAKPDEPMGPPLPEGHAYADDPGKEDAPHSPKGTTVYTKPKPNAANV